MALTDRRILTAPGGPHADPRHETVYQPSRGGHFPAPPKTSTPNGGR